MINESGSPGAAPSTGGGAQPEDQSPSNSIVAVPGPPATPPQEAIAPGLRGEGQRPKFIRRLSGMFAVDQRDLASISQPGKAVTVGATSTKILDKNDRRIFAAIVNDSVNEVYLTLGETPAVASAGIRLNANGGSIVFGLATDIPYTGQVNGIASGSSGVTVVEA